MRTQNLAHAGDALQNGEQIYLPGDKDPANFNYLKLTTRDELFSLFLRNSKIQKATVWFAGEVIRERWEFKKPQKIKAPKHGNMFKFTFKEWLEWNGFTKESFKAMMWSLLFGESIVVFYTGKEVISTEKKTPTLFTGKGDFTVCKAFYPTTAGNGYIPTDIHPVFGTPGKYDITLTIDKADTGVNYTVTADRVVRFTAPEKSLRYAGTSSVSAVAKDALIQEQIKRAVAVQCNMMQAGILAIKASTQAEKDLIKNSIGTSLSYLKRVYVKNIDDIEKFMKIFVPDLKMDQFEKMYEILQKDIATGIDMSISNLEGAPQGAQSSAAYDTLNTYAKVKQLQSNYKRSMEECFFKLGKKDTSFEWNDPTPHILPTPTGQTTSTSKTVSANLSIEGGDKLNPQGESSEEGGESETSDGNPEKKKGIFKKFGRGKK